MPRFRRKRTFRKKRSTIRRRPVRRMRIPRAPKLKSFLLKRAFSAAALTIANTAAGNAVFTFRLSDMPDVSDFTNLFQRYKINAVKIEFMSPFNVALTQTFATGIGLFLLYGVIDRNSTTALATTAQAEEYQSLKIWKSNQNHQVYFKPSLPMTVTDIAANSFVEIQKPRWISTLETGIEHLGFKLITDNNGSGNSYVLTPRLTYYMSFKDVF
nr:MAG: capsid protein [Cressdnaviricota sp.]